MAKGVYRPENEPAMRFTNELSRATNKKQAENVLACLTSVEQRLSDMDKMGVDVQAISCSPFQFMYSLDPELGKKAARAINENLAAIVQKHPDRFVALADVPLQAPDAAAEELDYCVRQLGFRGVEIARTSSGRRSRGAATRSGRRCRSSTSWCSCTPTDSPAASGCRITTSSTSSGTRSTPPSPSDTSCSTVFSKSFRS